MSPRRSARDLDDFRLRFEARTGTGTPEEGGGSLDGGLRLLARQVVEVDDPGLGQLVRLTLVARDGWIVAEEVAVLARPGGPPVNGSALRSVTVDAYVQAAWRALAGNPFALTRDADSGQLVPVRPQDAGRFEREQGRRLPAAEVLPLVAEAYRAALASSSPRARGGPTAEVGRRLGYSRGHAARLVAQAREAGLLGAARPGRAGERIDDYEGRAEGRAERSKT